MNPTLCKTKQFYFYEYVLPVIPSFLPSSLSPAWSPAAAASLALKLYTYHSIMIMDITNLLKILILQYKVNTNKALGNGKNHTELSG